MISEKQVQLLPGMTPQNLAKSACDGCGNCSCGIGNQSVIICLKCGKIHEY